MKRYFLTFLAAAMLVAAGCAQLPQGATPVTPAEQASANAAQLQANWVQSCLLYNGAQKAVLANFDKLSREDIKHVLIITRQITPMCTVQPADTQAAITQITQAVTTITILAGAQAAGALK